MTQTIHRMMIVLALATLLAACTRERPMPEATATFAVADTADGSNDAQTNPENANNPDAENTPADAASGEPQVATATPEAGATDAITGTPDANATPTPGTPETFQYVVQAGDTLGAIAERFETDLETLRRLNNLNSDVLIVGQPLYVPYVEGMTAEGMPTPTPGPYEYVVQAGDTLSAIALRFGVDPVQIIESNGLLSPDNLAVGSTIIIPGYQPPAADTAGGAAGDSTTAPTGQGIIHVVQAGEGLVGIATQYGVTVEEIVAANNLVDPNTLRVGQELLIPGITERDAAAAQGQIHVVAGGESLLGIAVRYGVTVEEIMAVNELSDPNALFVGQELIIPSP